MQGEHNDAKGDSEEGELTIDEGRPPPILKREAEKSTDASEVCFVYCTLYIYRYAQLIK